ncbi:MAG: PQQ-like beta-propeller repeat protein, partial [Rhodospirillales bacterium]|nr:PQQ-like beta-propeller repeat protein [Rhodospirillales bacterium]
MSQKLKPIISYSLLFLAAIVLTGCDNYFGQNKAPSLSGKRISILIQQRSIEPDSSAAGHKIVLPAPTPNNDWPQAGGYANHAMHHMRIGKALQERWSISVGRGTNDEERLMAQPIVAGNTLFSMDSETIVSAYNLKDGAEIWSVELTPKEEDDHVNGGLAYENGKVFATTGFGQVVAVAAKTGKVLWRRNVGAPVRSAPTARGNRVFAIAVTNKLFALNGETGAVLWTHSGIEEATSLLGGSSPAVDNGVVVA